MREPRPCRDAVVRRRPTCSSARARFHSRGIERTQSGAFKAFKGQAASSAHENCFNVTWSEGKVFIGILGFGRIAREMLWLCVAFGMDVAAHSPSLDADEAYESGVLFAESPQSLFARSTHLCCPAP